MQISRCNLLFALSSKIVLVCLLSGAMVACDRDSGKTDDTGATEEREALVPAAASISAVDIRPAVRKLAVEAVAGQFDQHCYYLKDEGPQAAEGEKVTLSADGVLSAGIGTVDYLHADASSFGFTVDRSQRLFSSVFDLKHTESGDRTHLIGVQQQNDMIAVEYTNETLNPARAIGCGRTTPLPIYGMSIWKQLMPLISFPKVTVQCFEVPAIDKGSKVVSAGGGYLSIDNQTFDGKVVPNVEWLQVGDEISYTFSAPDKTNYTLVVDPEGHLSTLLIDTEQSNIGCR